MLEEWIIEVGHSLCITGAGSFWAQFQTTLRREAKDVLHDQMVNSRNSVAHANIKGSARGPESSFSIEGPFNPPPPYTSTATLSIENSSPPIRRDTPPPYTPAITCPAGDRFAVLPRFGSANDNVVFAPGTFDGFTTEEIIRHYQPQVERILTEAMN